MNEKIQQRRERRTRRGRLLTLLLLVYGMLSTVLYLYTKMGTAAPWLAPFAVSYRPVSFVTEPAPVFLALAAIGLAGWLLLRLGKLWGRECVILDMVVYLALNVVFSPFYTLLASTTRQDAYLLHVLALSAVGAVYPVLVLIALHIWNPRRI